MGLMPEHFGIFTRANPAAHADSAKELLLVSVITAIPFAIGLVAFLAVKPAPFGPQATAEDYLGAILFRGQLFLISVSYIATSLHRLFNSDRSYRRPDIISVFSMLLFGIIGIFYGINPTFAILTDPTLKELSVIFFLLSILFYYYTAVLSCERPPPVEAILNRDADRLSRRLDTIRDQGKD